MFPHLKRKHKLTPKNSEVDSAEDTNKKRKVKGMGWNITPSEYGKRGEIKLLLRKVSIDRPVQLGEKQLKEGLNQNRMGKENNASGNYNLICSGERGWKEKEREGRMQTISLFRGGGRRWEELGSH